MKPMRRPVVALLTDYGTRDPYVAQIKAVIVSYRDDVVIIDVTHEVAAFNELEAAFLLRCYTPHMPPGTIHVCVVDPGVGAGRRSVILETSRGDLFVGPDTGFMAPAAEALGLEAAYEVDESWLPPRSSETFHGRDVFAHVAGRLASGARPGELGRRIRDYARMRLPEPRIEEPLIEATIMHVDRFGNLITNLEPRHLLEGALYRVSYKGGSLECRFLKAYGLAAPGAPLLTAGGTGYVELAVNRGSAAGRLGLRAGDRLLIAPAP